MKLSNKSIYALRVLWHLAEADEKKPLSAAYLAKQEDISAKYLEQVLSTLQKSGFLISKRGKEGGYFLREPPEKISLGDIIRAINGPLAPMPCASRKLPHKDTACPYPYETCWLRHLMLRVRDNICEVLDNETLANMAAEARKVRKKNWSGDQSKS
jgi:Rrf2 family protein